LHWK